MMMTKKLLAILLLLGATVITTWCWGWRWWDGDSDDECHEALDGATRDEENNTIIGID